MPDQRGNLSSKKRKNYIVFYDCPKSSGWELLFQVRKSQCSVSVERKRLFDLSFSYRDEQGSTK